MSYFFLFDGTDLSVVLRLVNKLDVLCCAHNSVTVIDSKMFFQTVIKTTHYPQGSNQLFSGGEMIATCCCTVFAGGGAKWL